MNNLKSQVCAGGQGRWTNLNLGNCLLSCENITNLKIAFVWQNSNSVGLFNTATDPSFAVDDIIITTPSSVTPPVADFSASETSICAGECISFTDLSTNTPTGWSLDI
jgi:PKD repeat protein